MPYRTMSLEEFAKYVGMDARQVRRLADRGQLPGRLIGGQWRFHRTKVTEWLQQEMHTLDEQRLIALEDSMSGQVDDPTNENGMVVTELIGTEGIDVSFAAKTKPSVLQELVRLADRTGLLYDGEGLLDAVRERETMCSTALPGGIAIPHPRQPMPYVSAEPLICVARHQRGIPFGGPTPELTRLFFLICCHNDRHHLHVLARLMRILNDARAESLFEAESADAMLETLMTIEREVVRQHR